MTTREEHLAWCKKRALECLEQGDARNAVLSMVSDLGKHDHTQGLAQNPLTAMMMRPAMDSAVEARKFIEGFK